ncbi:hypothetical protein DIPPA_31932 [Diplonema papillatum]|nr:hypothetical protein DIPPA_31932 [Diplonema papillatum]
MKDHPYYALFRKHGGPDARSAFEACADAAARRQFLDAVRSGCEFAYRRVLEAELRPLVDRLGGPAALEALRRQSHAASQEVCDALGDLSASFPPTAAVQAAILAFLTVEVGRKPSKRELLEQYAAHDRDVSAKLASGQALFRTDGTLSKTAGGSCAQNQAGKKREVRVRDLQLMAVNEGCVLEGKTVVSAVGMVGVQTVLEDANGEWVEVGLYNLADAPGCDMSGVLPKGCRLTIREPYLKLFKSGRIGIRVDDPADITITLPDTALRDGESFSLDPLLALKTEANNCLKRQPPNSRFALTHYQQILTALVPTFQPADFLQSRSSSGFDIFCNAADHLRQSEIATNVSSTVEDPLSSARPQPPSAPQAGESTKSSSDSLTLASAVPAASVPEATNLLQTVLSNMSLCALNLRLFAHAVCYALAGLALEPTDILRQKLRLADATLHRLCYRLVCGLTAAGQYPAALSLLSAVNALNPSNEALRTLQSVVGYSAEISRNGPAQGRHYTLDGDHSWLLPKGFGGSAGCCFPQWVSSSIAVSRADLWEVKGRGVYASEDLRGGVVVLLDRPLVLASGGGKRFSVVQTRVGDKYASDACLLAAASQLAFLASQDAEVQRIVSQLHHGRACEAVCSFPSLFYRFSGDSSRVVSPAPWGDTERLRRVLSYNSFGDRCGADTNNLYPAVAMFNHGSEPNACVVPIATPSRQELAVAVLTTKPVAKGSEICISYTTDEAALEKWGITA